jgi:hypothetical protein
MVPYTLSEAPPDEWKHYFSSRAPNEAEARIDGDRALYKCPKNREVIKGEYQNKVAKLVEAANLHCREINAEHERMQAKEQEEQRRKEQEQRDFEEWKRNW